MHFAVAACMRNEAIFILEWIAHQRLCGFRTVIVVTNDCTDGTDMICDEIAESDPDFFHVRSVVAPGESPQIKGMASVFALPVIGDVDYLLHCDSDEFLNIDVGAGQVADLLLAVGKPDCIALAWRPFGDAGNTHWTGGLVTEKCTRSAAKIRPSFTVHKSLFRPAAFGRGTDHMPKEPRIANVTLVNTKGEAMPTTSLFNPRHARFRRTPPELFTWENACIFHYAVRSQDVFLMKNQRGDGMGRETDRYHLNSKFWRRNNINRVSVPVSQQRLAAMKQTIANFRANDAIARIEDKALLDFVRDSHAYLTPERIQSLTIPS